MFTNNKNIFLKYIFSYFAVTILVFLCLSPIYRTLENLQRERSLQVVRNYTQSALRDFSTEQTTLFNTARNLYTDSDLRDIYYGNVDSKSRFYQATLVQKRMNLYFQNIQSVENVILYLRKFNYVITSKYVFSDRQRFYDYFLFAGTEGRDWLEEFPSGSPAGIEQWRCETTSLLDASTLDRLYSIYSFPMVGDGSIQMRLVVARDPKALAEQFLHPDISGQAFACLTDASGTVLAQNSALLSSLPDGPADSVVIDGMRHALLHFDGPDGMQLTLAVSNSYLNASRHTTLQLISTNIAVALLSGLLLSICFARQRVKPIERIVEVIRSAGTGVYPGDELHEIEGSVLDMINEINACKTTIGELDSMLTNSLLDRLFFTGLSAEHLEAFQRYFGEMPVPFIVLALDGGGALSDTTLARVAALLTQGPHLCRSGKGLSLCLLNAQDGTAAHVSSVLRSLRSEEGLVLRAGLSCAAYDIQRAAEAARVAQRRLRAGLHFPGVYVFTHTHSAHAVQAAVSVQDLDTLQRTLQAGNEDAADRLTAHIFEQVLLGDWDAVELQQLFFSLRTVYSSVLSQFAAEAERTGLILRDAPQLPGELEEYEPHAMEAFFIDLNHRICTQYQATAARSASSLGHAVAAFVDSHYTDPNLCACSVAAHFGISEKYVFQLIKSGCGETLTRRLATLRTDAATALLENTELSVADIALRTGFISANSMYKVFVRVKGVPPSAYRTGRT